MGVKEVGSTRVGSDEGENPNLWAGECDECLEEVRASFFAHTFTERSIDHTRQRRSIPKRVGCEEKGIALDAGAMKPPRLSLVEWLFWQKKDTEQTKWFEEDGPDLDDMLSALQHVRSMHQNAFGSEMDSDPEWETEEE